MHRRATIKDVAVRAGVSPAAVSRHLNRSIKLPADTVRRIDDAILALGYKPHSQARRLSLGRSDMIALVLPEVANPFFSELAAAAEQAAAESGLGLLLCVTDNRIERELEYLSRLSQSEVDGLLFITNHADEDDRLAAAINRAGAVVVLDEDVQGAAVSKIFSQNEDGGRLAAEALIRAGHRRFGYIGGPAGLMSAAERQHGFYTALHEAGLDQDCVTEMQGAYAIEHGRRSAERLLALPVRPTAIFTASDQILLGVLEVFRSAGIGVPQDISVVTFDDASPLAYFSPPISAIRQSIRQMGRIGIERLTGLLRGGAAAADVVRLPVEFIERQSIATPALSPVT